MSDPNHLPLPEYLDSILDEDKSYAVRLDIMLCAVDRKAAIAVLEEMIERLKQPWGLNSTGGSSGPRAAYVFRGKESE